MRALLLMYLLFGKCVFKIWRRNKEDFKQMAFVPLPFNPLTPTSIGPSTSLTSTNPKNINSNWCNGCQVLVQKMIKKKLTNDLLNHDL